MLSSAIENCRLPRTLSIFEELAFCVNREGWRVCLGERCGLFSGQIITAAVGQLRIAGQIPLTILEDKDHLQHAKGRTVSNFGQDSHGILLSLDDSIVYSGFGYFIAFFGYTQNSENDKV